MKDSEFIELLNLYLDHEISAADAARLEAEVQSNPSRRRTYQQYCRMQKACKMVIADFQTAAENADVSDEKVVPFDPAAIVTAATQRKRVSGFYTIGTFAAAAACVAIILVGRSREEAKPEAAGSSPAVIAEASIAPRPEIAPTPAAMNATPRGLVSLAPRMQTPLSTNPFLLSGRKQADAVFTTSVHETGTQLDWISGVQFTPLQQQRIAVGDLHFAATLQTEGRPLGNRAANSKAERETGEESVTFQVTK